MASAADQVTAGDLDGDGTDDLIGIWSGQAGIWVKCSQTQTWSYIASAASDIGAGKFAGGTWSAAFGKSLSLSAPTGGYPEGPAGASFTDISAFGPGGTRFVFQSEPNLFPLAPATTATPTLAPRIPGPGEPGFKCARQQKNLFPRKQ
jgi:hypothetical protein